MVDLHRNNWKPDTCDCKFTQEWDRDLPVEQRTMKGVAILRTCPEHTGITDAEELRSTIQSENDRKNNIINKIIEDGFPEFTQDRWDERREENHRELKPSVIYDYNFTGKDKNRVLHVRFRKFRDRSDIQLSTNERRDLQTLIDNELGGSSKVVLE